MRQSTENLIFLESVGYRDLHSAIKWKLTHMHAREHLESLLADVFALEQFGAECGTRRFDLTGQIDFLGASQQRNLSHLRQIHADRIIGPILNLFGEAFFSLAGGVGFGLNIPFSQCGDVIYEEVGIGLIDIGNLGRQILYLERIGGHIVFDFIQQ